MTEHQVGRIKYCKTCQRNHMFPRYQAVPVEDEPVTLVRFAILLFVALVMFAAVFIGMAVAA